MYLPCDPPLTSHINGLHCLLFKIWLDLPTFVSVKGQVQGQGVIFDKISVKARWERWCRWNCDLRVINARKKKKKKRHFLSYRKCRHDDAQIMWPYAYHITLGSRCKMANSTPKTKLILCPRDPQGYSRISLSLPGRILKEYRYSLGFEKSLKCSLHKWT